MRGVIAALALGLGVAGVAPLAAAQARGPELLDFGEYIRRQKELHGQRAQMHARFDGLAPVYPEEAYGAAYFKANGITPESHHLFAVTFDGQTRTWLFPAMDRNTRGGELWAQLVALKPGTKITLTGRFRRLGDTAAREYDPNRKRYGGGLTEVPSVLDIEQVAAGWVKGIEAHIHDLGRDAALVAEPIPLLVRRGAAAAGPLATAVADPRRSEQIRVNAARVLGELRTLAALPKLGAVVRGNHPEAVRTAAFAAMLQTRPADALVAIGALLQKTPPDPWAMAGVATLLESGQVALLDLQRAAGPRWARMAPGVAASLEERARTSFERAEWARAAAAATGVLVLDQARGDMLLLRGRATLAQPPVPPELEARTTDDLVRALELGATDVPGLSGILRPALVAGAVAVADLVSQRVLDARPADASAKRLRIEVLVHRGQAALAAKDDPLALTLAASALALDPGDRTAWRFKQQAAGRDAAPKPASRASMGGTSVALPADWQRFPEALRGREATAKFAATKLIEPFPGEAYRPVIEFVVRRGERVPELKTPLEFLDWQFRARDDTVRPIARGAFQPESGPAIPWGEFRQRTGDGIVLRYYWVAIQIGDQFVGVDLLLDPRIHDDHFLVAFDMIASIQLDGVGR